MKFFRDRCTAGLRAAFEHQRLKSRFGQVKGGYQPVVPATNDDDITSLRHLGRRPPKIFENFERREPSGSAHDSAARMGRRSAHVEVLNRRAELGPAGHRTQEEKLLEREFSLEDVTFAQSPLALQVERRDNLLVKNYVFDVGRVLVNCVDHVVAERFFLIVPVQTRSQLVGRVLYEAGKNVLAWRS